MADFIKQMQEMQDKMVKLNELLSERDTLVSGLARIDGQIRAVLNTATDAGCDNSARYRPHPNEGTDAHDIVDVMGEEPMRKDEIIAALKEKGCHIPPASVAYYLTNYGCFQKVKRGYWRYIKP